MLSLPTAPQDVQRGLVTSDEGELKNDSRDAHENRAQGEFVLLPCRGVTRLLTLLGRLCGSSMGARQRSHNTVVCIT